MKNLIIMFVPVLTTAQFVSAQKASETPAAGDNFLLDEITQARKDQQSPINALSQPADVGEPDSFGKSVKFLGTAATGLVVVYKKL